MSGGGKQWRERQYDSDLLKVIVSHKHVQVSNVELQVERWGLGYPQKSHRSTEGSGMLLSRDDS